MRVLFAIFPATAHLYPVVPLAWALHNQGHEVRVAVHPSMNDAVARTGLTALPFGDNETVRHVVGFNSDPDKLKSLTTDLSLRCVPDEPWHDAWLGTIATFTIYASVLDELVDVCREWGPDLVVWDPLCVPAAIAAEATGAAHARFLWGQDNVGWMWERYAERDPEQTPVAVDGSVHWLLGEHLARHGVELSPSLFVGQWTIEPRPDRWAVPTTLDRLPLRSVPHNGGGHVPDWVRAPRERPRVVLSLGIGGRGRELFAESGLTHTGLVRRLSELDIELVVTLAHKDFDGPLPGNVRVVDYVPLNQVLPDCAAIIHHGGDGTALAAGTFGVPQLVVPVPFWAEDNVADHIADQGAGLVVRPAELTGDAPDDVLADALSQLLTEERFAKSAAEFREELRGQPSPAELVPLLEERVARHRRR